MMSPYSTSAIGHSATEMRIAGLRSGWQAPKPFGTLDATSELIEVFPCCFVLCGSEVRVYVPLDTKTDSLDHVRVKAFLCATAPAGHVAPALSSEEGAGIQAQVQPSAAFCKALLSAAFVHCCIGPCPPNMGSVANWLPIGTGLHPIIL